MLGSRSGLGFLVLVAGLALGGAACNEGGDDSQGAGGSSNGGSGTGASGGSGSGSGNTSGNGGGGGGDVGTPGCGPTTTCAGSCEDQACLDACIALATPRGQELFIALGSCGTEANCMSLGCTIDNCPNEWAACASDYGENGYVCFAAGKYEACDAGGFCTTKDADGGAWGTTEAGARASAEADCTIRMNDLIIVESFSNGQAGVQELCAVTKCGRQ